MTFRDGSKRWMTAASLLVVLWAGRPAQGSDIKSTLELVPEDAWAFVIVRSLDQVDAVAARLQQLSGLPIPPRVTSLALSPLNLGDTVDMTRPVCGVLLDVQKMGGLNESTVALIPAKDAEALLAKLSPEETEEPGISRVMVMGEPAYAAVRGKTVIVGPGQDAVTKVAKTKKTMAAKVSQGRLKAMGASDIYISAAMGMVVSAYKDMIMPLLQMGMAATDPSGQMAQNMVQMFGEVASADLGLRLDDGGLAVTVLATPKPETDLEKLFGAEKGTADSVLALLPKDKYLFSMAATMTHSELSSKYGGDKPLSGVVQMMRIPGASAEKLAALDKEYLKLHDGLKRFALSFSALGDGSDGLIGMAIVAETKDAPAFVAGLRRMFAATMGLSDDEDFEAIRKNVVHKADAETVGGGKADTIEIRVDEIAEATDGDAADVEKMKKVFGPDMRIRFGAVGDSHVAMTMGGGKKRFEQVASGVKSSAGLSQDAGIVTTAKSLPERKLAEVYIAVDHIFQTMKHVAKAVGDEDEVPFDMPTLNAPVAFCSAVEDTAWRVDIVVPMKLLRAGKEMFEKYSASEAAEDDVEADETDEANEADVDSADDEDAATDEPADEDDSADDE
jgi:hypothetical protein